VLFRLLRAQVSKEIKKAKSTFYDKKVRPKRTACSKSWWKQIKRLTGKEKDSVTLVDPETELELNSNQAVTIINDFFADLTKDYPRINKDRFRMSGWSPKRQCRRCPKTAYKN
jgi:transcription antitermination factor NusG